MIGVFDSGIGGLTVVRAVKEVLPDYDIAYFGDMARTPYGNKSPDTVVRYAIEDAEFLLGKGAKIIIIGCNTVSSLAFKHITHQFGLPIFEVISPAVKQAVAISKKQHIGVIGSRGTVDSDIYKKSIIRILPNARVYSQACPLLVPLVEEGWLAKPETAMIVKKYLHPLKVRQVDTLILGCTHYPLLKKIIQKKIGRRVILIDSSLAVAETVKDYLNRHKDLDRTLSKNGRLDIYASDITMHAVKTARVLLRRNIDLKRASL